MKKNELITVLSTFAIDTIINSAKKVINEQKGGPAQYLRRAFKQENMPFRFGSPPPVNVEIVLTDKGEYGRVLKKPDSIKIDFSDIKTPFLAISTLLDEYVLDEIQNFRGKFFLDIQGYVREGKNFGKKKKWNPPQKVIKNIFCLKGTDEELRYIPKNFFKEQKNKILIQTRGRFGCEIFAKGKQYTIIPACVVDAKNTIGAGDTFFAHFICEFIRSNNLYQSARCASEKTSDFLKTKK